MFWIGYNHNLPSSFVDHFRNLSSHFSHIYIFTNLIVTPYFQKELLSTYKNWRYAVAEGVKAGLPLPGFTSALSYFEAYRSTSLPTNLIQAQRDYFGAHTYERIDRKGKFHTDW